MLLDILGDLLVPLLPTSSRVQRRVYQHPMIYSVGLGGFVFVGFSVAIWTSGEWPIPWTLTGGWGLGIAVFARLMMVMNVYVAKRQSGHAPLDEKRRMGVNAETYRAKHGPDRRRLAPEKPLPRLFEPPGVPGNSAENVGRDT
ncbi:hypothetical protein GCM10023194_22310 [Planotetraspora phitsanulokensis]|uniref:Uncharacterized protein n=1 Tax=Planotetraspora phitsanulokensis TaxID=575192 RepID=A0A8J3U465_9ACTN|nr:hypothetical protein [Planotetraspora phitsanulokensis]GII38288.1 hypothetical protein Pph01_32910 [Planotetraspora phitsanulokensis]